jgi:chromosome segregation ATPase
MSMNTKEAINEVRRFAQFTKAFQHLTEVADELANANNLIKERHDQADAAAALISEHQTHLDTIVEEMQGQEKELAERAEAAANTRQGLLAKAEAKARDITAEAQEKLEAYAEEGQQAAIQLRELRTNVARQQSVLDGLTRNIAKAREQARKIIGG